MFSLIINFFREKRIEWMCLFPPTVTVLTSGNRLWILTVESGQPATTRACLLTEGETVM